MKQETVYNYIDGNGNKFVIEKESIEYTPVKPAFSSSGLYNGGEYKKIRITPLQYEEISIVINNGIRNNQYHVKNRIKMSGMIVIKEGNDKQIYILAPHSEYLIKIEKNLQDIIYNNKEF